MPAAGASRPGVSPRRAARFHPSAADFADVSTKSGVWWNTPAGHRPQRPSPRFRVHVSVNTMHAWGEICGNVLLFGLRVPNESMGPGPFDSFGALRPFPCTRARNRAKCTPGRAPQAAPKGVLPGRKSRRCLRWPLGECTSAFSMHACTESREVHSTAARGCGVCPGHKGLTSASTTFVPNPACQ